MSSVYYNSNIWQKCSPLVLASGSKIRAEILLNAGFPIDVIPAEIDERALEKPLIDNKINAEQIAIFLASQKAYAVSSQYKNRYVLGCDQILVFNNAILTKSVSREIGLEKLKEMAGKNHTLISSAVLVKDGKVLCQVSDTVQLRMRILSEHFYEWYFVNSGDALTSSVGGYHLEKSGSHLFEKIEGDYFSTLGLPLIPLLAEFRRLELIIP